MSFRRVVVLATVLVAGAAMAQGTPQESTAVAASTAAPAAAAPVAAANLGPFSGDPAVGQTKAAVCGACHGIDGNSTLAMYPKLAGQSEHYIVYQLKSFKSGERQNPIMLGMASPLSVQDMHDIGAYFASQTAKSGVADEALVKHGGTLFREGDAARGIPACMSCHGPDGRGNPGTPYPQLAGQHAQYVQQVLTAWHDGTVWGDTSYDQIMPAIAKKLTTQDILAVSSYIEGLHTATGNGTAP